MWSDAAEALNAMGSPPRGGRWRPAGVCRVIGLVSEPTIFGTARGGGAEIAAPGGGEHRRGLTSG
jgi:hypothetical protein